MTAAIRGSTIIGKTLFKIAINSVKKGISLLVLIRGNISGIPTAAARLLKIIYVVKADSLPPSLPVITDADAAVGVITQTMIPSITVAEKYESSFE